MNAFSKSQCSDIMCCGELGTTFKLFFFYLRFSFRNIHNSLESRERRRLIFLSHLCHFHLLYRPLDTNRAITSENSPLHIVSSLTWTGNLWFLIEPGELLQRAHWSYLNNIASGKFLSEMCRNWNNRYSRGVTM